MAKQVPGALVIGIWILAGITGHVALAGAPAAPSAPVAPSWQRTYQFVEGMKRGAVAKLGLKGKSARAAVQTLLSEGYRCGLEPAAGSPGDPLSLPSRVGCSKEMEPDLCGEFYLDLGVNWRSPSGSFADLFEQLSSSPVHGYSATCTMRDTRSTEYLTEQKAAEGRLQQRLARLGTVGASGESAFRSLVLDGFLCGLESSGASANSERGTSAPLMRCTHLPSRTELCYQEEAVVTLKWPRPATAPLSKRVAQLGAAKVTAVQAVCGLPNIEGETSATTAGLLSPMWHRRSGCRIGQRQAAYVGRFRL